MLPTEDLVEVRHIKHMHLTYLGGFSVCNSVAQRVRGLNGLLVEEAWPGAVYSHTSGDIKV